MSIGSQLKAFLSSPRGQRLVERGRRELSKPENQARIRTALDAIRRDKITKR